MIDNLQIEFKVNLKKQQVRHAEAVNNKSKKLKALKGLVNQMLTIRNEMSDAVKMNKKIAKKAIKEKETVKATAAIRLETMTNLRTKCAALKDEVVDSQYTNFDLEEQIADLEEAVDELTTRSDAWQPFIFKKHWVKFSGSKRGNMQWKPEVDKLCLEMLANRTPPTCIQSNILAMAKVMSPNVDIVNELPSLKHIRSLGTVLSQLSRTLAAMRLGNAKEWKQLHYDETSRRQISLTNCVMSILNKDKKLETICISGSIITKDGTADVQSKAIVESFYESVEFLNRWRETTEEIYADHDDLDSMCQEIPSSDALCPSRILGGMISGDNCPAAMRSRYNLVDLVVEIGKQRGYAGDELNIFTGNCHQHLRNVWVGAVSKMLNRKLTSMLKLDLCVIPAHLRVKCDILEIERCLDKAFNGTANYKKGVGDRFVDQLAKKHPGKFLMPVVRVLGGNRQDAQFEASMPAYMNRPDYMEFLHEDLCTSENILLRKLFTILESVEMIAQLRLGSVFFLAIIVPTRWLAANTHKLSHRNWGESSMGKVIDILYQTMLEIVQDGTKGMDEDYIMNIFKPIEEELPEFKAHLDWYFEAKESNLVDSFSKEDRDR